MPDAPPVVAVVPTFRPPESTRELLVDLAGQVDRVVVSDDASPVTSDELLREWESLAKVEVLRHDQNRGIARGLNDGLRVAVDLGSEWLLTVDQDSRLPDHYVDVLLALAQERASAGEKLGAIGAEVVVEVSGEMAYPLRTSPFGPTTDEVIQTGTLWNVAEMWAIGGFDERLGIDAVDAAACLALRQRGFTIAVAPGVRIEHSIGAGRTVRVAGRSVLVTGHSPQRRTSMVRNRLRLFPAEFRQSPRHALRTLRRVAVNHALGLLIEGDRWSKAKASMRGITGAGTDNLKP